MGGRNTFLGIAYVVVGGICIVLGAIFAITHLVHPRFVHITQELVKECRASLLIFYIRKLGDHTYLSWNNVPSAKHPAGSSTAMASGRDLGPTGGA